MHQLACLADIETLEKTPLKLPVNTFQLISESAMNYADQNAIEFLLDCNPGEKTRNYTYHDLLINITKTANAFYQLGVRKNDAVSLLLPNLPQTHFAFWGAQAIGIANPINPLLEPEHIISILNTAQSKVLVTVASADQSYYEKILMIAEKVATLESILIIGLKNTSWNLVSRINMYDFDDYVSQRPSDSLEFSPSTQSDDISCYLHTGGTTGAPKLAIITHANLLHSAWSAVKMLHFESTDKILACLPLFHVFGIVASGLAAFMAGTNILIASPRGFRDEKVVQNCWRIVADYQVTIFLGVPTIYSVLSALPIAPYDISKVKYGICGSSPLPIQTAKNFEKYAGFKILEGYGMTESASIMTVNPRYGERLLGSAGLGIPFQRFRIIKTDEAGNFLSECKFNEIGHITVKGPNIFQGYKGIKQSILSDGWFDTGDLGYQDKEGYLWIKGRSKDLIIRGGHNIDPQIIEEVLYQHPAVLAAAAVGKPCAKAGELPVAYVSLKEKNAIDENTLLVFVAERISERAAIPKNIFIMDSLPVTAVGKIYKPTLRMDAIKRVLTEELAHLETQGIQFNVSVSHHVSHGQLATVKIKQVVDAETKQEIYQLLKHYPIATEVISEVA